MRVCDLRIPVAMCSSKCSDNKSSGRGGEVKDTEWRTVINGIGDVIVFATLVFAVHFRGD